MSELNEKRKQIIQQFNVNNMYLYKANKIPLPPCDLSKQLYEFEKTFSPISGIPPLYKIYENICDYNSRNVTNELKQLITGPGGIIGRTSNTIDCIEKIFVDLETNFC